MWNTILAISIKNAKPTQGVWSTYHRNSHSICADINQPTAANIKNKRHFARFKIKGQCWIQAFTRTCIFQLKSMWSPTQITLTGSLCSQQSRTACRVAQYVQDFDGIEAHLFGECHCLGKTRKHGTHQHVEYQLHLCRATHLTWSR